MLKNDSISTGLWNQKFITLFMKAHHFTVLHHLNPVLLVQPYILKSLDTGLQRGLSPQHFLCSKFCMHVYSLMHATCTGDLVSHLIVLIISEEYKLRSCPLHKCLHPPVTTSFLAPHILCS
jgi:hypothetical protein